MTWQRWFFASFFLLVSSICASLVACKVPVFRYALERWPSDDYRMVAIIEDRSGVEVRRALDAMSKLAQSQANVKTETVVLSELSEAELWQIDGIENTDAVPLLQVFYPTRDGKRKLCWSGGMTLENVQGWRDSITRQRIVEDLQSGVSAVWVLVPGDDEKENARIKSELGDALQEAQAAIQIPEGVIARNDAAGYLQDNPGASMDDVLRSDIPLRIEFSVQLLQPRDDWALMAMVNHWHEGEGQKNLRPPYVFPVFGRGRMIEPLAAERFTKRSVVGACQYLVGECSCTVKAQNPGMDLLLTTAWQDVLGDQVVMIAANTPSEPRIVPIPDAEPARSRELNSVDPQPTQRITIVHATLTIVACVAIAVGIRRLRS